jgi:hypothetical protein
MQASSHRIGRTAADRQMTAVAPPGGPSLGERMAVAGIKNLRSGTTDAAAQVGAIGGWTR